MGGWERWGRVGPGEVWGRVRGVRNAKKNILQYYHRVI